MRCTVPTVSSLSRICVHISSDGFSVVSENPLRPCGRARPPGWMSGRLRLSRRSTRCAHHAAPAPGRYRPQKDLFALPFTASVICKNADFVGVSLPLVIKIKFYIIVTVAAHDAGLVDRACGFVADDDVYSRHKIFPFGLRYRFVIGIRMYVHSDMQRPDAVDCTAQLCNTDYVGPCRENDC